MMLLLQILNAVAASKLAGAVIAALLEWRDAIQVRRVGSAPEHADPIHAEVAL